MVISEEEYNKKHRRYRFREMGPYQWEEEITATKKKKKAKKKSKKKAKKKKKKQKYSSGFLKAVKELELVGVIKETKKNTFKLVKNKHEKEETIN